MSDRVDAYIAVGSNQSPRENILKAMNLLDEVCPIDAVSTFYRTRPIARPNQPFFLNGVCRCQTTLEPRALKFDVLRPIEHRLGRSRTDDPHAARTIDLDIVLMGKHVVNTPDLQLPDPEIYQRAFVAVPLYELAPEVTLPDTGIRLSDVASQLADEPLEPDVEITEALRARFNHE